MSETNSCRLCRSGCNDSFRLYDDSNRPTELYNIAAKYFEPKFIKVEPESENPVTALCKSCWTKICRYHNIHQITDNVLPANSPKQSLIKMENQTEMFVKSEPSISYNEDILATPIQIKQEVDILPGNSKKQSLERSENDIQVASKKIKQEVDILPNESKKQCLEDPEEKIEIFVKSEPSIEEIPLTSKPFKEEVQQIQFVKPMDSMAVDDIVKINEVHLIQTRPEISTSLQDSTFGSGQLIITDMGVQYSIEEVDNKDTIPVSSNEPYVANCASPQHSGSSDDQEFTDEYSTEDAKVSNDKTETSNTSGDSCNEILRRKLLYNMFRMDMAIAKWMPSLKCRLCSQAFKTFSDIQQHFEKDHKGSEFYIECCKRKFSQRYEVKEHAEHHTKPAELKCDICHVSFVNAFTLKRHRLVHEAKNQFACDLCDKTFKSRKSLGNHSVTHTGKMPFSCEYCDKKFRYSSSIYHHLSVYHPEVARSPNKDAAVDCPFCDEKCRSRSTYYRHLKKVHPEKKDEIPADN
ncbi:uncharacterized protein LOC142229700 [Haematobia irritans]|uniref:uncharacterized protein LOC142229700 n=1 Tax=Haematobia irritans TaxID=7368 RepID=UPI003F5099D5